MLHLYAGPGAGDFVLNAPVEPPADERRLFRNATQLLRARQLSEAAALLETVPFRLYDGANHCADAFCVLHAELPLEPYEALRRTQDRARASAQAVAEVLTELGRPIRHVAVAFALDARPHLASAERARALTPHEIDTLVYRYIGVSGGYLGDFSYAAHRAFYVEIGLQLTPEHYAGTTRERFTQLLGEQDPATQARILDGVLARFPVSSSDLRTEARAAEVRAWITRLRGVAPVASPAPAPALTAAVVERALRDAEQAVRAGEPTSATDRAHTALHGFLLAACDAAGITAGQEPRLDELLALLRQHHPAFVLAGPRRDDIIKLMRALAQAAEALNPLRNHASVAHPSAALLDPPEAMLAVNAARSILHYINAKLSVG